MAALISFPTLGKWLFSLTSCYCTIVSEKSHPTCKEISAARPMPWSSEPPLHPHAMTSEKKRLFLCLGFSLTWPALLTGCWQLCPQTFAVPLGPCACSLFLAHTLLACKALLNHPFFREAFPDQAVNSECPSSGPTQPTALDASGDLKETLPSGRPLISVLVCLASSLPMILASSMWLVNF